MKSLFWGFLEMILIVSWKKQNGLKQWEIHSSKKLKTSTSTAFPFPFPSSFPLPDEFHRGYDALDMLWISARFRKRRTTSTDSFLFQIIPTNETSFPENLFAFCFFEKINSAVEISAIVYRYASLVYNTLSVSTL